MTKHARRLTVAVAVLGAVALSAAGPSLAHRVASNPTIRHPVVTNIAAVDGDYVEMLTRATQPIR